MSYTIEKTISKETTDEGTSLVQMVKTDTKHVAVDFERNSYVDADVFRFESGSVKLEDGTVVELTRLLLSCSEEHHHGVFYQSPREMELWEVMMSIGEVNGPPVTDNAEGDSK